VRHRIAIVLAAGALALVAAATAQAAPAGADAGNDQGTVVYLTCTDGTTYTIDTSEFDPDQVAPYLCPDGYTVSDTPPDANPPTADTGDNSLTGASGVDVGIDAPSNQQPDPTLYSTQVQCPDGTIWAIAIGDSFTCP
jgi:hypothetical protein